jgi:hypothetical protein
MSKSEAAKRESVTDETPKRESPAPAPLLLGANWLTCLPRREC